MIIQFIINGLIQGLLYAVVAMAFALTYNTTRIFHIAYAGVLVVASYLLMLFLQTGLPMPISIALSILLCGLLNVGVEEVVYLHSIILPMFLSDLKQNNYLIVLLLKR